MTTKTVKKPLRKCTGCKEMKEKNLLMRVVKIKDTNEYEIDKTLKADGRGAYVCKTMECFGKAQKSKGFERSFKGKIPQDIYEGLRNEIEKIYKIQSSGGG